jgi:hypothetical protein
MTILVARALDPPRWPLAASIPELAVSDGASHPDKRRHCGVVTRSPASRRPRPRPPCRTEAIGRLGHYGQIRHDRPDRSFMVARAPLLRFYVPFSTRQPRRALFPKAAGLRTCPASAFPHFGSPSARALIADLGQRRSPLRFFASRRDHMRRVARDRRTVGVGRSIVANVSRDPAHTRVCRIAGHAFIDREDAISRRLPVLHAGAVGETDSSLFVPHARGGPVGPSCSLRRFRISPPGPGHSPTRPLARCSGTRCHRV